MDGKERYVSVAALIGHPEGDRLLICERSDGDSYRPGDVVFPSGRVEGLELLENRLFAEVDEEVGMEMDWTTVTYIGNCTFERKGLPVTQICYYVRAVSADLRAKRTDELKTLKWVTPKEFYTYQIDAYVEGLKGFVRTAVQQGFLSE